MLIEIPISPGELLDKITILEIKSERLGDEAKRHNVLRELELLEGVRDAHIPGSMTLAALIGRLKTVNERLWEIEDDIRASERGSDFGPRFIELARAVYFTNDERSALKREINTLLGSTIVEEKGYEAY